MVQCTKTTVWIFSKIMNYVFLNLVNQHMFVITNGLLSEKKLNVFYFIRICISSTKWHIFYQEDSKCFHRLIYQLIFMCVVVTIMYLCMDDFYWWLQYLLFVPSTVSIILDLIQWNLLFSPFWALNVTYHRYISIQWLWSN